MLVCVTFFDAQAKYRDAQSKIADLQSQNRQLKQVRALLRTGPCPLLVFDKLAYVCHYSLSLSLSLSLSPRSCC